MLALYLVDWSAIPTLLVIWSLACGTVAVGALWSGSTRKLLVCHERNVYDEPLFLAVYVMLTFIMIGSVVSLVVIFDAVSFPMACISVRLPNLLFPCFVPSMELRHHLVLLAALGIPTLWLVFKSHQHAWVLQNFIGVSFALNIVRCAHLPNFRVITMSSILLFFYDIFMVFVTGYLQKGESVMEVVANEVQQLPVLMRVPRLNAGELAVCESQFSILGYGDMIIPGLAISYCRCFDVLVKDYSPYFILSMTCYGLSLVLAFVGSVLMNTGQPALLYLVPGTLVPVIIVSWWRGEFQDFWTGKFKPKPSLQTRIDIWASTSEQFQMIQGRGLLYVSTPVIEWMAIPLPVSEKAYNAQWN
ncbi:conserved hypothetical protein [Ixodes scapularis]|uniref:Signal peptide peptidase-like 2B n=1 Tax=Ixodes scapularis TaxID=6945 RepID=B7QAS5_IXOSC|nr:conserved hypothetical protein [Ixodes scapularis]|eukprot:XP_002412651.1 conserved hypothetical protein [Ixodes scapularis]